MSDQPHSSAFHGDDIRLTYANLRAMLDAHDWAEAHNMRSMAVTLQPGEGSGASLVPDGSVVIHDHPHSGRPREIHFMVDGQKIAEFGPPDATEGVDSDVAPGYISFLGEWMGQPVHHVEWKNRIMADNGLLPDRGRIDELAAEVSALYVHMNAPGIAHAVDADRKQFADAAKALADAVLAAHTVHASYTDALTALEGRH